MKIILLYVILFVCSCSAAVGQKEFPPQKLFQKELFNAYTKLGEYKVKTQKITVSRDTSTFEASVFLPQSGTQKFPIVVFGHGFFHDPSRYNSILRHISSWGFIVIAPHSHTSIWPNHKLYADDLILCVKTLQERGAQQNSEFFQKVADQYSFVGHSMGGGAAILAAKDSQPEVVITYAAAETKPSAIEAIKEAQCPQIFLVSEKDAIIDNDDIHSMFHNSKHPSWLITIKDAWHCGYEDVSYFGCDHGSLDRGKQISIAQSLTNIFLQSYAYQKVTLKTINELNTNDYFRVIVKNID